MLTMRYLAAPKKKLCSCFFDDKSLIWIQLTSKKLLSYSERSLDNTKTILKSIDLASSVVCLEGNFLHEQAICMN